MRQQEVFFWGRSTARSHYVCSSINLHVKKRDAAISKAGHPRAAPLSRASRLLAYGAGARRRVLGQGRASGALRLAAGPRRASAHPAEHPPLGMGANPRLEPRPLGGRVRVLAPS